MDAELSMTIATRLLPCPITVIAGRARASGQGEQGEDLEDEQRVALQPLEEGRGLAVAQGGVPEQQARHRHLAAPHLEEVQEEQRARESAGQEQGERTQEAHDSRSPLSWRSTNSSTGVSVTTRW